MQVGQKASTKSRRWYGTGVSVPQGGPARDLVQDTRYKSQDKRLVGLGYKGKLASWLRVQGKFKGSNTPKGQRPGELLHFYIWSPTRTMTPHPPAQFCVLPSSNGPRKVELVVPLTPSAILLFFRPPRIMLPLVTPTPLPPNLKLDNLQLDIIISRSGTRQCPATKYMTLGPKFYTKLVSAITRRRMHLNQ